MEGDDGSGTVRPAWAIDLRERLGRASGSNLKIKLWEEKEEDRNSAVSKQQWKAVRHKKALSGGDRPAHVDLHQSGFL